MRAIVQKVKKASVKVSDELISEIGNGLLVFVAVTDSDNEKDIDYIKKKIEKLRIFEDSDGKMNFSVEDEGGQLLIVSQFTLYGDARKGNRPSFINSSNAKKAEEYYEILIKKLKDDGFDVKTGKFQTHMEVSLINDGPVTIQLDSERLY